MKYTGLDIIDNGFSNVIDIEEGSVFKDSKIIINGNGNRVIIGKSLEFTNLTINLHGNSKFVNISPSNKFIRNLKVVSIRGDNQKFTIGNNFSCGGFEVQMNDGGEVCSIGDDCLFSWDIKARTSDGHSVIDLNTNLATNLPKNIYIGNRNWFGENIYVMKGAEISDDCVVASCSVVTKSISEKNCLIGGYPATILRRNIGWDRKKPFDYNEPVINSAPPLSLVTVVCLADFKLLELQMSSIKKYCNNIDVKEHIVICNDRDLSVDLIKGIVKKISYNIPVRCIEQIELLKLENTVKRGWYTQQVCKLAVHEYVSTDFYLVLDSKNFLINPLITSDLFVDGKPKLFMMSEKRVWGEIIAGVCDFLDVSVDHIKDFSSPSTPYMICKDQVKLMYEYLISIDESIEDAICDKRGVTEFICYYVFLFKFGGLSKYSLCHIRDANNYTIFRSAVFDSDLIFNLENKLDSLKWFGIHLQHLLDSNSEKDKFIRYLISNKMIFDNESEINTFLSGLQ